MAPRPRAHRLAARQRPGERLRVRRGRDAGGRRAARDATTGRRHWGQVSPVESKDGGLVGAQHAAPNYSPVSILRRNTVSLRLSEPSYTRSPTRTTTPPRML